MVPNLSDAESEDGGGLQSFLVALSNTSYEMRFRQ